MNTPVGDRHQCFWVFAKDVKAFLLRSFEHGSGLGVSQFETESACVKPGKSRNGGGDAAAARDELPLGENKHRKPPLGLPFCPVQWIPPSGVAVC